MLYKVQSELCQQYILSFQYKKTKLSPRFCTCDHWRLLYPGLYRRCNRLVRPFGTYVEFTFY